jgi:hypothetical protein
LALLNLTKLIKIMANLIELPIVAMNTTEVTKTVTIPGTGLIAEPLVGGVLAGVAGATDGVFSAATNAAIKSRVTFANGTMPVGVTYYSTKTAAEVSALANAPLA